MRMMVLCIALAMPLLPLGQEVAQAGSRQQHCRFQRLRQGSWTPWEVRRTIRCAVRRWPVEGGISRALSIADRESSFGARAVNPYSGACGVYQHIPTYWPGRHATWDRRMPNWELRPSCKNGRTNVVVTIRMAHTGGWGHWE